MLPPALPRKFQNLPVTPPPRRAPIAAENVPEGMSDDEETDTKTVGSVAEASHANQASLLGGDVTVCEVVKIKATCFTLHCRIPTWLLTESGSEVILTNPY